MSRTATCLECGPETRIAARKPSGWRCGVKKAIDQRKVKPEVRSRRNRQYTYGISAEEYDVLLERQGHRCGICREILGERYRTHLDHDKITGRVRGILCIRCNTGLGHFNDDPEMLEAALDYLRNGAALVRV